MPKRKREEQFTLGPLWRLLRWLHVPLRTYGSTEVILRRVTGCYLAGSFLGVVQAEG